MADSQYDLVVVGGGIHGLMIGLFSAKSGRRTLLVERHRLGQATTAGWFGILHGGLRYLQSLDVMRFRESLYDSRWFAREFPDLVRPQPFLMPLYGTGLKRSEVFRAAFLVERILGFDRNFGLPSHLRIPRGRVMSRADVIAACPQVERQGLRAGAVWYELVVIDTAELMSALRDMALRAGLTILEETEARALRTDGKETIGLETTSGTFKTATVVNAAGSWSNQIAATFDKGATSPLAHPCLAFNVLVEKTPPSEFGLALNLPESDGGLVFMYPSNGETFVGTSYLPCEASTKSATVPRSAVDALLKTVDLALAGYDAIGARVASITSGILPARTAEAVDLIHRDVYRDHGASGGPVGLHSVWGIKFTTAPSVARRVLRMCSPHR